MKRLRLMIYNAYMRLRARITGERIMKPIKSGTLPTGMECKYYFVTPTDDEKTHQLL